SLSCIPLFMKNVTPPEGQTHINETAAARACCGGHRWTSGTPGCAIQAPFDLGRQLRTTTRPRPQPPRMQAVDAVASEPVLPAVEQCPRNPRLPAGRADSDLRRTTYDLQPHPLYALVEGNRSSCPKVVSLVGFHSGTDRADGPHFLSAEVSTLMRLRTH